MFASQLLRILQTIPSDVKSENGVYDSVEQDMTMKENQNSTLYDSRSFGREVDPLPFGSKDVYQLNVGKNTHPFVFEVNDRDECWNATFVDDFLVDNRNGTRDSIGKEFQNGVLSDSSSPDEDSDSLSSDTNEKDKVLVTAEEFTRCNENESLAASDLFQTDANLYTDKNATEFEQPELMVCYKEINYHVVKDICVDEGMDLSDSKDDQSGHSLRQSLNDDSHREGTEGVKNMGLCMSDGLAALSLGNMKNIGSDENGCRDENPGPKSPSESSSENDTAVHFDSDDTIQKGETNVMSTKNVAAASEDASFVDRTLPIQEFGTRSFLRSFLNSLDGEENKVAQLQDQISSGKPVPECPAASSGQKEDVQESILYYNSKVESSTITFNFNFPATAIADVTNGGTENVKEHSTVSTKVKDVLNHKSADSDNLLDTRQVHCNNNNETIIGKFDEQSLKIKNASSDFSQAQSVSSKETKQDEIVRDQSPKDKNGNSNNLSSDSQVVESHVLKLEKGKYDEGEASFSAAGVITYSEPIPYSGSISHRSDGSATSGRSFAFPILQSEWNSSPERMMKGDGTHFRKHKGWRSGLLCCRF